jgi:hypothetical protein
VQQDAASVRFLSMVDLPSSLRGATIKQLNENDYHLWGGSLLLRLRHKQFLFIRHRTRLVDSLKGEIVFNLNKVATWLG